MVSGPDTGRAVVVGPGLLTVGAAAQAAWTVDDPRIAPVEAVLALGATGRWRVEHCGEPAQISSGSGGADVALGGGVLRLEPLSPLEVMAGADPPSSFAPASVRAVVRRPRPRMFAPTAPAPRPDPPPADPEADGGAASTSAGPLLSGAVAFVGAVMTAAWFGQPAFAMAGGVALIMSCTHAWIGRRTQLRRRQAIRARRQAYLEDMVAVAVAEHQQWVEAQHRRIATVAARLDVAARLPAAGADGGGLWERRPADGDAFTVAVGIGEVPWHPHLDVPRDMVDAVEAAWRRRCPSEPVPVGVDLEPGVVVALRGPAGAALARSMVVQLAVQCGPADWGLRSDLAEVAGWEWSTDLPHVSGGDDELVAIAGDGSPNRRRGGRDAMLPAANRARHTVWLTDRVDDLVDPGSPLRRRLDGTAPPAVLALLTATEPTPAVCTAEVATDDAGTATVQLHGEGRAALTCRFHGIGVATTRAVVAALRAWSDPEHTGALATRLPEQVGLGDLLAAAGDRAAEPVERDGLRTPLGVTATSTFWFDLVADGPHVLVAGTTGSGKSELLRSLVVGLAARYAPAEVAFVLVDYKGGSAFDVCADLAHVVGSVTDLDAGLAARALRSLRAEIVRRERVLRDVGASDLGAARHRLGDPVLARLVIVVDEFAALASELPEFLHALVGIAQRGRSLGMHLVLATQRPAGVVSDDIRANTNARLALRLNDVADALDVVGDAAPATLPRRAPGRAVARLGASELIVFQSARCDVDPASLVTASGPASASPWCEPLPSQWLPDDASFGGDRSDIGDAPIALVDLPDEQRQHGLCWTVDGHLVVVGAVGAGVTTALRTVALHAAAGGAAAAPREVLVVDARGDPAWDETAAASPAVVVVRLHERERLRRLLIRAGGARRHAAGRALVVIVDGVGAVRRELNEIDRIDDLALLERLMLDATPEAAMVVLGTDTVAAIPAGWIARCAQRWVLRVNDPLDALSLGAPVPSMREQPPGRGILVPGGHEAQWAARPAATVRERAGRAAPAEPIGVLAPTCPSVDLPRSTWTADGWAVAVGIGFDDLQPAILEVRWDEHLTVVGAARSGRSAVLARLLDAWSDGGADPAPSWSVHTPRRSPLSAWSVPIDMAIDAAERARAAGGRHLLLVDDAELLDDPGGRLMALVQTGAGRTAPSAGGPGRVVVVAAGRGDALRQRFGHWTTAVRQSRLGLVMAATGDADGDLLGAVVPRRLPLAARPGLAHLVGPDATRLVQVGWSSLHRSPMSA